MRLLLHAVFFSFVLLANVYAQTDSAYIMHSGDVIGKYKLADIDSIIFYNPLSKQSEEKNISILQTFESVTPYLSVGVIAKISPCIPGCSYGVVIAEHQNPTPSDRLIEVGVINPNQAKIDPFEFTHTITGLDYNTTYYYKLYVLFNGTYFFTDEKHFSYGDIPSAAGITAINITNTSAVLCSDNHNPENGTMLQIIESGVIIGIDKNALTTTNSNNILRTLDYGQYGFYTTLENLEPGQTYWARSYYKTDYYTDYFYGKITEFTTKSYTLTSPELVFPVDSATVSGSGTLLQWKCDGADDQTTYSIYYNSHHWEPGSLYVADIDKTEHFFSIEYPDPGQEYSWKVVAKDGQGNEMESPIYRFFADPMQPAEYISPENEAVLPANSVTLKWQTQTAPSAQQYKVYFSTEETGNFQLAGTTTDTVYQLSDLTYGQKYFWKVVSVSANGNLIEGDVWSLSINNDLSIPQIITPQNGQTVYGKPFSVTWLCKATVAKYSILIKPQNIEEYTVLAEKLTATQYFVQTELLEYGQQYEIKVLATDEYGTSKQSSSVTFTLSHPTAIDTAFNGTVTDIDGNIYKTVKLGTQIWMAENLRVSRYPDGRTLPFYNDKSSRDTLEYTDRAYCYFDTTGTDYTQFDLETYGGLYNWVAATDGVTSDSVPSNVQGICPNGWHIPSSGEWSNLTQGLINSGYYHEIASYPENRKSPLANVLASNIGWEESTVEFSPGYNMLMNNITGFNALPTGYIYRNQMDEIGSRTAFASSSTRYGDDFTEVYTLVHDYSHPHGPIGEWPKTSFVSVRCIKD